MYEDIWEDVPGETPVETPAESLAESPSATFGAGLEAYEGPNWQEQPDEGDHQVVSLNRDFSAETARSVSKTSQIGN